MTQWQREKADKDWRHLVSRRSSVNLYSFSVADIFNSVFFFYYYFALSSHLNLCLLAELLYFLCLCVFICAFNRCKVVSHFPPERHRGVHCITWETASTHIYKKKTTDKQFPFKWMFKLSLGLSTILRRGKTIFIWLCSVLVLLLQIFIVVWIYSTLWDLKVVR